MPGSSSSPAAAAGLHEVLQFLGEYLAGRLRHRSDRIPVLHQLRPQLGVAERVHRHHLVSRVGDRGPVRGSRPGLRNDARSATVASRRRGTFLHRGRPGPAPGFISIDDRSSVARRLRARDAHSPACRTSSRTWTICTPDSPRPRDRLRRDAAAAFRVHHRPARLSFRSAPSGPVIARLAYLPRPTDSTHSVTETRKMAQFSNGRGRAHTRYEARASSRLEMAVPDVRGGHASPPIAVK